MGKRGLHSIRKFILYAVIAPNLSTGCWLVTAMAQPLKACLFYAGLRVCMRRNECIMGILYCAVVSKHIPIISLGFLLQWIWIVRPH